MARYLWLLTGAPLLLASACGDGPTGPEAEPAPPPNVRPYVTGAALENLDANGHFRLPRPAVESPYPMIAPEQADEIALAVIRTWFANPEVLVLPGAASLVEIVERDHGAPIDWGAVRLGPRTAYFAESHLEPLPASFGNPTIRTYGPHFLVPLYVKALPVVVVGVAAYATNVIVDGRGFVQRVDNLDGGGEFRVDGVPLALKGITVPPGPEVAVEFVFTETRSQVVEVPVLGVPGNRVVPTGARWLLRLTEQVEFERLVDGQLVRSEEIYVGLFRSRADLRVDTSWAPPAGLRMLVAAAQQPTVADIGVAEVPLRPGFEVDLHEVVVRR